MIVEFLELTFSRHDTCNLLCDTSLALARSSPTWRYTGYISGLDLSFAGSQGEYHHMWRCPRPGLNPSGLVNNSSLAAGSQFTEMKIL